MESRSENYEMALSSETRFLLMHFFCTVAELEHQLDRLRQKIADTENFCPLLAFKALDVCKNGYLTSFELIQFLKTYDDSVSDIEIYCLLRQMDLDSDGMINLEEFMEILLPLENDLQEKLKSKLAHHCIIGDHTITSLNHKSREMLSSLFRKEIEINKKLENKKKALFSRHDFRLLEAFRFLEDHSYGYITIRSLSNVMEKYHNRLNPCDYSLIFRRFDRDRDQKLSYLEFVEAILVTTSTSSIVSEIPNQRLPGKCFEFRKPNRSMETMDCCNEMNSSAVTTAESRHSCFAKRNSSAEKSKRLETTTNAAQKACIVTYSSIHSVDDDRNGVHTTNVHKCRASKKIENPREQTNGGDYFLSSTLPILSQASQTPNIDLNESWIRHKNRQQEKAVHHRPLSPATCMTSSYMGHFGDGNSCSPSSSVHRRFSHSTLFPSTTLISASSTPHQFHKKSFEETSIVSHRSISPKKGDGHKNNLSRRSRSQSPSMGAVMRKIQFLSEETALSPRKKQYDCCECKNDTILNSCLTGFYACECRDCKRNSDNDNSGNYNNNVGSNGNRNHSASLVKNTQIASEIESRTTSPRSKKIINDSMLITRTTTSTDFTPRNDGNVDMDSAFRKSSNGIHRNQKLHDINSHLNDRSTRHTTKKIETNKNCQHQIYHHHKSHHSDSDHNIKSQKCKNRHPKYSNHCNNLYYHCNKHDCHDEQYSNDEYHKNMNRNDNNSSETPNHNNNVNRERGANNNFLHTNSTSRKSLQDIVKTFENQLVLGRRLDYFRQCLSLRDDFNLLDFWRIFDKKRKGYVLYNEIIEALRTLTIHMTYKQAYLVIIKYSKSTYNEGSIIIHSHLKTNDKKKDSNDEEILYLRYSDFCKIFLPKNLEYAEIMQNNLPECRSIPCTSPKNQMSHETIYLINQIFKLLAQQELQAEIIRKNFGISGLYNTFKMIDRDKDGFISFEELRDTLQQNGVITNDTDVKILFDRYDESGDGKVSFLEFLKEFSHRKKKPIIRPWGN